MSNLFSPKYLMKLIGNIETSLWKEYSSNKNVHFYIDKWHKTEGIYGGELWDNFIIAKTTEDKIDLSKTLHNMDGETLLKIAIDLGLETPDFIPAIPTFRNEIKSNYQNASITFEKAFKQIEEHPDVAIGLANSALESILKEILKDSRLNVKQSKKTLYELTSDLLKAFHLFPNSNMPKEIKTIGSSLLAINQSIEKLRSEKTDLHGKTEDEYIIKDPIYTYFIVNSVSTIGLFLQSFYRNKYLQDAEAVQNNASDELPF